MGLGRLVRLVRLGLMYRKASGEWEKEMGKFDGKKNLKKGGMGLLQGVLIAGGVGIAGFLADPEAVKEILTNAGVGEVLIGAAVPLLAAVAKMVANFLKHGGAE